MLREKKESPNDVGIRYEDLRYIDFMQLDRGVSYSSILLCFSPGKEPEILHGKKNNF